MQKQTERLRVQMPVWTSTNLVQATGCLVYKQLTCQLRQRVNSQVSLENQFLYQGRYTCRYMQF